MGLKTLVKIAKIAQQKAYYINDIPKDAIIDIDSTFQEYLYAMAKYGEVYYEVKINNNKAEVSKITER